MALKRFEPHSSSIWSKCLEIAWDLTVRLPTFGDVRFVSRPSLHLGGLWFRRIVRYLPECEEDAKSQNHQREGKDTDDFTKLPSNLLHPPLAAFVETDHSRHRDLP